MQAATVTAAFGQITAQLRLKVATKNIRTFHKPPNKLTLAKHWLHASDALQVNRESGESSRDAVQILNQPV